MSGQQKLDNPVRLPAPPFKGEPSQIISVDHPAGISIQKCLHQRFRLLGVPLLPVLPELDGIQVQHRAAILLPQRPRQGGFPCAAVAHYQ